MFLESASNRGSKWVKPEPDLRVGVGQRQRQQELRSPEPQGSCSNPVWPKENDCYGGDVEILSSLHELVKQQWLGPKPLRSAWTKNPVISGLAGRSRLYVQIVPNLKKGDVCELVTRIGHSEVQRSRVPCFQFEDYYMHQRSSNLTEFGTAIMVRFTVRDHGQASAAIRALRYFVEPFWHIAHNLQGHVIEYSRLHSSQSSHSSRGVI